MTTLAVVLGAIWLLALTVMVFALARQTGLLLATLAPDRRSDAVLAIGAPIPDSAVAAVRDLVDGRRYLFFLSSSCLDAAPSPPT